MVCVWFNDECFVATSSGGKDGSAAIGGSQDFYAVQSSSLGRASALLAESSWFESSLFQHRVSLSCVPPVADFAGVGCWSPSDPHKIAYESSILSAGTENSCCDESNQRRI